MAATLILQYQACDDTFIHRVMMAMLATANNLNSEAAGFANHANRMALMKAVSNSPQSWAPIFTLVIAAQGVDGASTDTAIQTMIANCWNTVAGVP